MSHKEIFVFSIADNVAYLSEQSATKFQELLAKQKFIYKPRQNIDLLEYFQKIKSPIKSKGLEKSAKNEMASLDQRNYSDVNSAPETNYEYFLVENDSFEAWNLSEFSHKNSNLNLNSMNNVLPIYDVEEIKIINELPKNNDNQTQNDSKNLEQIEQNCLDIFVANIEDECKASLLEKNLLQLDKQQIFTSPMLLFYAAWLLHQYGQHKLVLKICRENQFPDYLHQTMQILWDESVEILELAKKNKFTLSSVQRFRLRKKFLYPKNIWNGHPIKYGMTDVSKEMLIDYYNNISKKPNKIAKEILAQKIGKSVGVVNTFFKNRRTRNGDTKTRAKQMDSKQKLKN